jgi:hypothetical protein
MSLNKLFLILGLFLLSISKVFGVGLAWDPSPDTNVTGYAVYYGTNSGSYSTRIDVLNVTNVTIPNSNLFQHPLANYFVVTAYTITGVESLPSNEVSYNIGDFPPVFLSGISNKTIYAGQTAPKIPFIVNDPDSPVSNIVITVSFTNNTLFSSNSFLIVGSGTNRNLYITPNNATGRDSITLVAQSASLYATNKFIVYVINYVNTLYVATGLEFGTNLSYFNLTNINLMSFTNPPTGQVYRQSLIISTNVSTLLEYGTNLNSLTATNINLMPFTNGMFYKQYLILTNNPF